MEVGVQFSSLSSRRSHALMTRHSVCTVMRDTPTDLADLLAGQTSEEAQLDDLGLAGVELFQLAQCRVQGENVFITTDRQGVVLTQRGHGLWIHRVSVPLRARARSTRMRRIAWAPTAKKWVRLFQSTCDWPTRRKYASCTSSVGCRVKPGRSCDIKSPCQSAQVVVDERQEAIDRRTVAAAGTA